MQLNTLLRSIEEHWNGADHSVTVLYNFTEGFGKGYELLKQRFPTTVFVREGNPHLGYSPDVLCKWFNLSRWLKYPYLRHPKSDFRSKLIRILETMDTQYVMFLTDDSKFIADVKLDEMAMSAIRHERQHVQYSLRLGIHINNPCIVEPVGVSLIRWRYDDTANQRDWRYNFSVDAHIYDKETILALARKVIFSNPNSYEAFTTIYCRKQGWLNVGYANLRPCILSFPINMVQNVQDNESLAVSIRQLEEWFEDGYELDYPPLANEPDTFQYYPNELILRKDGAETIIKTK